MQYSLYTTFAQEFLFIYLRLKKLVDGHKYWFLEINILHDLELLHQPDLALNFYRSFWLVLFLLTKSITFEEEHFKFIFFKL